MAFESAIISNNSILTGDDPINFTESGFGTPDGAIILGYKWDSGNTNPAQLSLDACCMIALWDGTNIRSMIIWDEDGVASTDTASSGSTDRVLFEGTFAGLADYTVSNITDGIRLTRNNNSFGVLRMSVILLKGFSNIAVGHFTPSATNGGTVTITPSFQISGGIFIHSHLSMSSGSSNNVNDAALSVGYMSYDGSTIKQNGHLFVEKDGLATSDPRQYLSDSRINNGTPLTGLLQKLEITSVSATQFVCTSRSADATARDCMYLVFKCDSGDVAEAFDYSTPTSTGNQSYSGLNNTPELCIFSPTYLQAVNTNYNTGDAEPFHIGCMNSTDEVCGGFAVDDNVGTTATYISFKNDAFSVWLAGDANDTINASFVSMDSGGFTLNFARTDGTARVFSGLSIGAESSSRTPDLMPFFINQQLMG